MIPENKHAAVEKALQAAFGVNDFEDIQQLTKGLSGSLVFKIIVRGNPYSLRVITREESRDKPQHYFSCIQTAAAAGLAPAIHYLSIDDKISITDFIKEQIFPLAEAKVKMPETIQHLHALPKFPYRVNYLDAADSFLQRFQASNILPESATKTFFELYARIVDAYPRNDQENLVSCHNDLKRDNIIFDGTQPWLVDWEAAFLNDRYVDLAAMANFVVEDDKDEADFLARYFGEVADEYMRARFFLMSEIVHMFCFTICMMTGAASKPHDPNSFDKNGFREFHDRLWNCEISLGNNEGKLQYALVHKEEFLRKARTRRFKESLRIVSQYTKFH